MQKLRDQVVLITGASRGLGAAIARAMAGRGARVALMGRSRERLELVANDVRKASAEAIVLIADVRGESAVARAVADVLDQWGHVDVLVNVAGVKVEGPMDSEPVGDDGDAIGINYLGAMRCCRAVLPAMRRKGRGQIVNVSSVLGKRATPYRGAYSASKAALNAATDALRVELVGTGIGVTLVCPGRLGGDGRWAMSFERAAEAIVRCVERGRREVILTWSGRALVWLSFLMPSLVDRLMVRVRDRRRGEQTARAATETPDMPDNNSGVDGVDDSPRRVSS